MSSSADSLASVRLPGAMWEAIDDAAKQRGTDRTEVLVSILGAWKAAGAPDPGVPLALAESGQLEAHEVAVWRGLIWWLGRQGIPTTLARA